MKENGKKLTHNHELRIKTYSSFRFSFCICASCSLFLTFCFISSGTGAETPLAPLDPTDFLASHPVGLSEEASTPNVPRQVAIPQQVWAALSKYIIPEPQETTGIFSDNHPDQPDHNLSEGGLNVAEDLSSHPEPNLGNNMPERVSSVSTTPNQAMYGRNRQLWRARLSPPVMEKDDEGKDELQKLILQIYSIEFKRTSEPTSAVETVPTREPNETSNSLRIESPEELEEKETALKPAYGTISDQTLQMLRELLRHPDRLDNPFELAEVLFLSGHVKEAALAYKEALNRKIPSQSDSTHDRAWILLQIGNCLRYDDLPAAVQSYRQLIREYPDSPWSDLAKAQHELIEWQLEDKPGTLITKGVSSNSLIASGASESD
jgi:hypothetical protein